MDAVMWYIFRKNLYRSKNSFRKKFFFYFFPNEWNCLKIRSDENYRLQWNWTILSLFWRYPPKVEPPISAIHLCWWPSDLFTFFFWILGEKICQCSSPIFKKYFFGAPTIIFPLTLLKLNPWYLKHFMIKKFQTSFLSFSIHLEVAST